MNDKARRLFHWLLTGAAAGICAIFSLPCAAVLILFSGLLFGLYEAQLYRRRQTAKQLCDEIDRILRGEDRIDFDEYREGELSVLAAEIHKMTVRLREQNAALRKEKQFAKEALEDISHQLRTPLTSVMMILGLMGSPGQSEAERMEYLRELYELLSRMKWLIETMLGLSRIEADAVRFAREPVSCRALINRAVETVSVTAELKGVEIQSDLNGEPGFVGDLRYTAEALVNLLKTPSSTRLREARLPSAQREPSDPLSLPSPTPARASRKRSCPISSSASAGPRSTPRTALASASPLPRR